MADATTAGSVELLTPEEVAEWLRISRTTVYRLVEKRRLPFIRVGGALRVLKSDVLAFIAEHRVASAVIGNDYGSKKNERKLVG